MATLELVEKLKKTANVSYEDAKTALDACNDDLLDAVIYLERQGKVAPPAGGGHYAPENDPGQQQAKAAPAKPKSAKGETFADMMRRFGRWCCSLLQKSVFNQFEVWRKEDRMLSVPVVVLVLLLVFCFWVTVPLLIVGLCCGCRYRFQGEDLRDTKVNDVMDSAAKAAVSAVDQIKSELDHLQGPKEQ